jgi:hypothetical protein
MKIKSPPARDSEKWEPVFGENHAQKYEKAAFDRWRLRVY